MKKINFPVGQKVRGYGVLNEYGEFDFIPEQTGARQGAIRQVKSGDGFTVSTTKKNVIVHLNFKKGDSFSMVRSLMAIIGNVINILRNYEI